VGRENGSRVHILVIRLVSSARLGCQPIDPPAIPTRRDTDPIAAVCISNLRQVRRGAELEELENVPYRY
jgi:hypothetical protein